MTKPKIFEGLQKISREEKQTCQKTRKRFYKNGSFQEETKLPCGQRARWKYEGNFYCVNCWNKLKEKLTKKAKKPAKPKAETPVKKQESYSGIRIPSDQEKLKELAAHLELELNRAKSVKDFLAYLNGFGEVNRTELLKTVEETTRSFSLAHLIRLEWKIK